MPRYRTCEIGLAYDDFGAGQARLVELVDVPPDYLKFDMRLVQNLDSASLERQRMLASLVKMVHDLGITPLAEGIETEERSRDLPADWLHLRPRFLLRLPVLPKQWIDGEMPALPDTNQIAGNEGQHEPS